MLVPLRGLRVIRYSVGYQLLDALTKPKLEKIGTQTLKSSIQKALC